MVQFKRCQRHTPTDNRGKYISSISRTKYLPNDEWITPSFLAVECHILFYGEPCVYIMIYNYYCIYILLLQARLRFSNPGITRTTTIWVGYYNLFVQKMSFLVLTFLCIHIIQLDIHIHYTTEINLFMSQNMHIL